MGEYAGPVITPVGVRDGFSNGDRTLSGVVGPPGSAPGSSGTTRVAGSCAFAPGSFSSRIPPAPAAAPASSVRREIGVSLMIAVLEPVWGARRLPDSGWREAGAAAVHTPDDPSWHTAHRTAHRRPASLVPFLASRCGPET